jgi:hypothetical protein
MTKYSSVFPLQSPRIFLRMFAACWLAAWILCVAPAGVAATRADLYQTTAHLPDRSESSQTGAFQTAMKTVLIRVTGRRSADQDPALAPLVAEARRFVQQYRAAPDNELWIAFDGTAIERWLAQNGQPIWGRERPSTFVWLAVSTGPQSGSVVRSDENSDLKAALDAEAATRGIPLRWPTADELQSHHIDYAALYNLSMASLADLAQRLGAEGVLIGRPAAANGGATLRWVHLFQDRSSEFVGPLAGVDGAADAYAALFAASGTATSVDIEVGGVGDVGAYAKAQSFLESLSFVSHVSVEAISGDRTIFRLTIRGGASSLQRALALNGPLEPVAAGDNGLQRFHLRP